MKEFVVVAYISSVFSNLEPDIDFKDKAIVEVGIKILREAKGRII